MKDPRDEPVPYWLQTSTPAGNGGILGQLAEHWNSSGNSGILGQLAEPWSDPPPTHAEQPMVPLTPENMFRLWLASPSARPAVAPWNDPRLTTSPGKPSAPTALPFALPPPTFAPAPPLEHPNSGKYWPVAPASLGLNEQPPAYGSHLPPIPQAQNWDQPPSYSADDAARSFSQPPNPASSGPSTPGVNPAGYSRADEAALAQQAYDASATRLQRGVRGRATAAYEPPARNAEADASDPGLVERTRLNGVDSFYRGTLMGAGRLALMQHYASTPDEPGIDPQTKRWRDQLRKEHPGVVANLARYDRMRRFENPLEFGAAAVGQLGGGLPTPESAISVGAKGIGWLARAAKAGLKQGAVNAATDPIVQGLNIKAGAQEKYNPWRTAISGGVGALLGSGVQAGMEAVRAALAHRRRSGSATNNKPSPSTVEPQQQRVAVADDTQGMAPSQPEPGAVFAPQEEAAASVSVPAPATLQGYLFDHSRLHEVPPVEQRNLPRYQPARGVPEYIQALDTPENLARMNEFARIGLERGGHGAFNLEEFRQHYLAQLGVEKGQAAFERFANLLAAVGPLSTDLAAVRNASYYDWLSRLAEQEGKPLPVPIWDSQKRRLVLLEPPPFPWGHIKEGLHAKKVNEVITSGRLEPISNPKLASIAENYKGNYMPIPLDSNYVRAARVTNKRGFPTDVVPRVGYGFVEQLGQRGAAQMGIPPGHYQAAVRAGAAEHTGLRSLDPILMTLEDRIAVTAAEFGITKEEVLRTLIRHGFPLLSLAAMAPAYTDLPQHRDGIQEQDSDPGARLLSAAQSP